MQRDVALIESDIWEAGPGAAAEEIAQVDLESEGPPKDMPGVEQALGALSAGADADVARVKRALVAHRAELPPTFDAILGLISLEVERLQGRNYRDDEDAAEAKRQIGVLSTLYQSVEALKALVPEKAKMSASDAEKAEKLSRLYVRTFKEWPRANAEELVDSVCRLGLVGATATMLPMIGITTPWAVAAGIAIFGNKKLADALKIAKEAFKD
ncbi:MAG: hypothetical protein KDE08_07300 [Rhodobacteraceae bacterium]|nr:hypothetical protein [Paracoccaceae bacterium]